MKINYQKNLLFLIIGILFALSGCSSNIHKTVETINATAVKTTIATTEEKNNNYDIQLYGKNDSELIKGDIGVYQIFDEEYKEQELVGAERNIDWLGVTYKGKYKYTRHSSFNSAPVLRYETDTLEDGRIAVIDLKQDSGEIIGFRVFFKSYDGEFAGYEIKSEAECRSISDKYLKKILNDDYQNYKFEEVRYKKLDYGIYWFTYYREIDGEKTAETITIQINCYGESENFNSSYFGMLKDAELPRNYNEKEIEKAIGEKIIELAKDENISWSIKDKRITVLNDNKTALYYAVDLTKDSDQAMSITHLAQFVITMD